MVSSWLDIGINALSVAHRLILLESLQDLTETQTNEYRAKIHFQSGQFAGEGTIRTRWNVQKPEKRTELQFESGTQLLLDHQSERGRSDRITLLCTNSCYAQTKQISTQAPVKITQVATS